MGVLNGWDRIRLVCGNHGDDTSHEMYVKAVNRLEFYEKRRQASLPSTAFYACPEYKSLYQKGAVAGRSCNNRLSVGDYQKVLAAVEKKEAASGLRPDLVGWAFRVGNVACEVVAQTDDYYVVKALNRRAILS